jgi:hypothetical protein
MDVLEWIIGIITPLTVTSAGLALKFWSEAKGWKISYEREKEASDRAQAQIDRTIFMADLANTMTETFRKVANETRSGVS